MDYTREDFTTTILSDGKIQIEAAAPAEYKVYWSACPAGFTDDNELPSFTKDTVMENPLGAARRSYYHIFGDGRYSVAAPRVLIADGQSNLRDIGGYNTADMQAFVKFGTVYRSHVLGELLGAGKEVLDNLGLDTIIDFRTPSETEKWPDPDVPGAEYFNMSPMAVNNPGQFAASLDDMKNFGEDAALLVYKDVKESYRTMPFGNESYQKMFRLLLDGRTPMLFHCAAGKDRTGIAAALILSVLDVPRDTIFYDYMLTNDARTRYIDMMAEMLSEKLGGGEQAKAAIRFFVGVERSSLEGTFEAIDAKYADMRDYFHNELLLSDADIEKLKDMLLVRHRMD